MHIKYEDLYEDYVKLRLTEQEIATKRGFSKSHIGVYRRKWGIPRNPSKRKQDLQGKKFGKWTVIKFGKMIGKHSHWLCECECGNQKLQAVCTLNSGSSLSCKECQHKKYILDKGKISTTLINKIKYDANERNINFNLDKEYLLNLFIKQNKKCALSGLDISLGEQDKPISITMKTMTASLDRIDSNKGYTEGNVQWVHKWVNHMKWSIKQDDFLYLCNQISKKHPIKDNYIFNETIHPNSQIIKERYDKNN